MLIKNDLSKMVGIYSEAEIFEKTKKDKPGHDLNYRFVLLFMWLYYKGWKPVITSYYRNDSTSFHSQYKAIDLAFPIKYQYNLIYNGLNSMSQIATDIFYECDIHAVLSYKETNHFHFSIAKRKLGNKIFRNKENIDKEFIYSPSLIEQFQIKAADFVEFLKR